MGKIGEGSYSEVFRAVERRSGFVCALKVLEKQKMREMGVQENVVREIKIHMFLEHPNIAKLYACFHNATHIYLVQEYCTDRNLYEAMRQPRFDRRLTHEKATQLVAQIAEAVRFLHKNAIIHRDVKPENILLTMVLLSPRRTAASSSATSAGPSTTPTARCASRSAALRSTSPRKWWPRASTTSPWTSGRWECSPTSC